MTMSVSKLAQLRELSVVVADTGDYAAIEKLRPVDCTTNPTLVKKALDLPVYAELIEAELARAAGASGEPAAVIDDITWEGIEAARVLQAEGIDCNLTLIFNPVQALACAEAGAFLISPFVGRILDWYVARGQTPASIDEDPGVVFVRGVYNEFKRRGIPTVVMGASFRSTAQVEALAGCDRLTISPELLEKLDADHGALPRQLSPVAADGVVHAPVTAESFAAAIAADAMAEEKLRTGIEGFVKDLDGLRQMIAARIG